MIITEMITSAIALKIDKAKSMENTTVGINIVTSIELYRWIMGLVTNDQ